MKKWIKMLIITLVGGIPAFFLGPIIWQPTPELQPTPTQLPFFILLSIVESMIFGFGVAFIILGWPSVAKVSARSRTTAKIMFGAIAWSLVSWWPHDNLHIHTGMDAQGLLYIDYAFHTTLIIAAVLLAFSFFSLTKENGRLG